jgi:hypothetical protein
VIFGAHLALSLLADNLLSGALLLGKPLPDWRAMELSRPGFEILINGEVKGPAGTNRTPDIVEMIGDIVKLCGDLGMEIPADTIITTGTSTGLIFATQGDYVELRCGSDILVDAWF